LAGSLAWLVGVVIGTELWYQAHERTLVAAPKWTIHWPAGRTGYQEVKVPDRALGILRCSDSKSAVWRDEEGNDWNLIYLSWPPTRTAVTLIGGHRPDICLSGAGWRMLEDRGQLTLEANGVELSLRHYLFDRGGRVAHVFHWIWEDRVPISGPRPIGEHTLATRLQAAIEGRRQMSRTVVELALAGPASPEDATQALEHQLRQIIHQH
jgi:hypothetical protein